MHRKKKENDKNDLEIMKDFMVALNQDIPLRNTISKGENGYVQFNNKIISLSLNKIHANEANLGLISKFENLRTFIITRSDFSIFPEWIQRLQVKSLIINFCQLSNFPQTICSMKNLQELDLAQNNIKKIPELVGNLIQLQKLNLSHNQLSQFPEHITKLENLIELNISYNEFFELASFFDRFKKLEILLCSNNKINSFLFSKKIDSLTCLDLSSNDLEKIPPIIFECNNLQELLFHNNKIKEFPSGIKNLKDLRRLIISENFFLYLPEEIKYLRNLEELSLSSNKITEIPKWIYNLSNLKAMTIDNNLISKIPDEFFELDTLTSLDLSKNPILFFSNNFSKLSSIKEIALKELNLTEFPEWMRSFKLIEVIVISNNKIQFIPSWLSEFANLRVIFLNYNEIHILSPTIFSSKKLEIFDITGNPLISLYGIPKNLLLNIIKQLGGKQIRLPKYAKHLIKKLEGISIDLYEIIMDVMNGEMIDVDEEIMSIIEQNLPTPQLDDEEIQKHISKLYDLVIQENSNFIELINFYQFSISELVQMYIQKEITDESKLIGRIIYEITPDLRQYLENKISSKDPLLKAISEFNSNQDIQL